MGLGFRVDIGLGFRVEGLGYGFGVAGGWFRIWL